jgi:hypothetical protein
MTIPYRVHDSENVYANFVYVTERSRHKHDKNVWEWSHVLGKGMDFQAKKWSFLFRNGLIERVVCRHIDKPIEIHNSECSKTRKLRFYSSVNTG